MRLTEFLEARIAEDAQIALAASNPPWVALTMYPTRSQVTNETEVDGGVIVETPRKDDADVEHIARHDPARVLAECEAKRRIIAHFVHDAFVGEEVSDPEVQDIFGALALPYADHPDYREEWRP